MFVFFLFYSRLQASKGSVKVAKNAKLFLGFGVAMCGSSLTYGTHWMVYEYFKRHLTPLANGNESLIPFVYMASASMGIVAYKSLYSPIIIIEYSKSF